MLLTLNDSLSGLENIYDDQELRRRNGQDVHELGSLVAALGPAVKKFITAKNSDGVSKAQNLFKKGTTLLINRKNAASAQKQSPVNYLPVPQIIQPPAPQPVIQQTLPITFSDLRALLRPQVTEYVPQQPKPMPQIIQHLPAKDTSNKIWIPLAIGAGFLALSGMTYLIVTRQRPIPLSGSPMLISRSKRKKPKAGQIKKLAYG